MEMFYLEVPSIERKDEALEYIKEHREYNSNVNGSGGLDKYADNNDYEGWLKRLDEEAVREPDEERVPRRTFFLIRENDNRIVGMINIRTTLNERLKKFGGHIGYGVRPTERRKGYNKINLYLGLQVCDEYGIDKALLDADLANVASWKTMEALGGIKTREYLDDVYAHCTVVDYTIDVKKSLEEYRNIYEPYIAKEKTK